MLTDVDNNVRLALYGFFVDHGRPPVASEISPQLGLRPHEVEDSYRRLHDAHVIVLVPGTPYVWMANPLCAIPSPYRVRARDRDWWGVCIWDSMGVVAMLGGDGTIETRCPDCADPMKVEIRDGKVAGEGLVHFAVPARHWWDDIGFN